MSDNKNKFIKLIKSRSKENSESLKDDFEKGRIGKCMETLRTELDSFIRIMYIGSIPNIEERERLIDQTLSGQRWTVLTNNNKWKTVTDRDMVEKAKDLKGYIHYVYKFGCRFIHLSDFHDYYVSNPFDKLNEEEKVEIKNYLNQYHSFPLETELSVESLSSYIPEIFNKISTNLACYYDEILRDELITT